MKAVVQRADPSKDYKVIEDIWGSSLDHSNIRFLEVKGEKLPIRFPQSKIIIDATIKGPKELFERPEIPPSGRDLEE
jgi:3-polyprenyl-4-hydroxybenzoate decarboxylase